MRRYLEEHSGAFGPDEIRVLVAAFDKAWESVQASGAIFGKWGQFDCGSVCREPD
jgi:hypothetical protein